MKPKVEKYKKEIPPLQKKVLKLKERMRIATPKAKARLAEELLKEETSLEVANLYLLYRDYYLLYKTSYQRNNKNYEKGVTYCLKIKKRYKALTAERFPNPETEFNMRYGKQLADKRKKAKEKQK